MNLILLVGVLLGLRDMMFNKFDKFKFKGWTVEGENMRKNKMKIKIGRNKQAFAVFQMILLMTSMFSFAFVSSESEVFFQGYGYGDSGNSLVGILFDKLREPMIPLVFATSHVDAVSQPTVCCEKTKEGASCVNTLKSECADGFASSPTSCETTSYCRPGTCYDSDEGICMGNTPKNICDKAEGAWDVREVNAVPQCQLGCCIIGDQAAFVPLVRCKKLSTFFGVPNDYRTDITSEVACIAEAQSADTGACVEEINFERVCEFTTRSECGATDEVDIASGDEIKLTSTKKFYKDTLCSAEELSTSCAKAADTVCYQGDVYFQDSCGNRENVYSTENNGKVSWNNGRVKEASEICDPNDGSNNNRECGNCDYLLGTRCSVDEGLLGGVNFCKKTVCKDRDGNNRINGESWCVYDANVGDSLDPAGSRHYREICDDGEVIVEPCADFRNEVCTSGVIEIESTNGKTEFESAICRVNRWQDCASQTDYEDCINIDKRDCNWVSSFTGLVLGANAGTGSGGFSNPTTGGSTSFQNPTATGFAIAPITGNAIAVDDIEPAEQTNRENGVCVPNIPPGLKFWEGRTAPTICGQASSECTVTYGKGLLGGGWEVKNGEECLEEQWALKANRVCTALGDCGGNVNFVGVYTDEGYEWKEDGDRKRLSRNSVNVITGGFAGYTVLGLLINMVLKELIPFVSGSSDCEPGSECFEALCASGLAGVEDGCPEVGEDVDETTNTDTIYYYVDEDLILKTTKDKDLADKYYFSTDDVAKSTDLVAEAERRKKEIIERGAFGGSGLLNPRGGSGVDPAIQAIRDFDLLYGSGDKLRFGGSKGGGLSGGSGSSGPSSSSGGGSSTKDPAVATTGTFFGNPLVQAVGWAGVAFIGGQLLGGIIGFDSDNTLALSTALAAGTFAGNAAAAIPGIGSGAAATGIGIGIAVVVFVLMYEKTKTETVAFECLAWQPPVGSESCEKCNDGDLPCSEYRCRSLGQNCELVNKGSAQEICVSVEVNDALPPVIKPNFEGLTVDLKYTNIKNSPPGPGFKIERNDSECLKAFSSIEFGITTNEPSQCRIDPESTDSFDSMRNFFGLSNLFLYNHSETLVVPSAAALKNSSIVLQNGKELNLFIRCRDKNGNTNEAEYAVRLCVDESPDTTTPEVKTTSILNGGCVAEGTDTANVEFGISEPSECRWSHVDQGYDAMTNGMNCSDTPNSNNLFPCSTELGGIARDGSDFYIRCKDGLREVPPRPEEDRNPMSESFVFSLIGSTGLRLGNLKPNGNIFGGISPAPIEIYAETSFGCYNGRAVCFYSDNGIDGDFIQFLDTNTEDAVHTQRQDLFSDDYEYTIKCIDAGGNVAIDTTSFKVEIDTNAPVIARMYEEGNRLKIVTVRDSECSYTLNSCDFSFEEGILMANTDFGTHFTEWNKENTYYIKCRDEFQNENAECSAIIKPSFKF